MKQRLLVLVLVFVSLICYGQDNDASIGYWGKKEPAVEYKTICNAHYQAIKFVAMNRKLGTNTDVKIDRNILEINHSVHPKVEIDIVAIADKLYVQDDVNIRYNLKDIIMLPNDNIVVFLKVNKKRVVGGYKLPDQIVNVDGANYFVPGGYVPQKEETASILGLVLDSKNKYRLHKAFYVPRYNRIIPSVNSRIYLLASGEKLHHLIWGYQFIHCLDYDGNMLWHYANLKDGFKYYGLQEFKDNLYLFGSVKGADGLSVPISVVYNAKIKDVKDISTYHPHGYFLSPSCGDDNELDDVNYDSNQSSILKIKKEGLEFRLGRDKNNTYVVNRREYLGVLDEDKQYLSIY